MARVYDGRIDVRASLPPEIAQWAVGHELGHVAGLTDERECDYVGAAIQAPRRPFLQALAELGDDWPALGECFGITSTSAVLRAGELTGRALAVVTPRRVYGRGEAFWPDETTLRHWARHGGPGLAKARLRDDLRRVVVEAAAQFAEL